jgi:hypothetical protein
MKKKKFTVMVATFLAMAAIMGCASNANQTGTAQTSAAIGPTGRTDPNTPDFYLNPPQDPNYIFGVGNAKMQSTNRSQQAAEHRARTSLTFQLNAYVRAMQVDYGKEAGTNHNMAAVELFENVDRQLASASLRDATVVQRFIGKDGTHWALVSYPKDSAKKEAVGIIENAASKAATIQKDAALKAMDAAFEQMSRPQLVDSGE